MGRLPKNELDLIEKICNKCKEIKPVCEFYLCGPSGKSEPKIRYTQTCRKCHNTTSAETRNKEEHKKYQNNWAKMSYRLARLEIYNILGRKCVNCGFSDPRALDVDHVNNDGGGRKRITNAKTILSQVKKNPERFQILCRNCNWIKLIENDEKFKDYNEFWEREY